jgi:arylsulfatase A-like enzyme/Flp pilus assembly protein TadD
MSARSALGSLWVGLLVVPVPAVAGTQERPDVLLITVDTLRPDALGWIGGTNATPAIDALAASGFRFPRAIAPAPLTLPSHVSMMTGLTPRRHGVRDNGRLFPANGPQTLAERLRAEGYATAAFVSGFPLAAMFGLDRGFEVYDDRFESRPAGGGELERSAAATADAALAWLATPGAPRFLWVHFYDPHDPYGTVAPGSAPGEALRRAYDGEVRAVDAAVARLRSAVRPGSGTLTVLAADHGESLGEHGESTHGFFVYQSTIEVPMVFAWPGRVPPGESAARVRLVDLAPTVLGLLGLPAWSEREGVSLEPRFGGSAAPAPPAFVESLRPWHSYGWAPLEAVVDGDLKLIAAPRPELYDLAADPAERSNRLDDDRRSSRRLAALLRARAAAPAPSAQAVDDPETVARLRALGYVGGGAAESEPPAGLPDPKDRIETWNRLGRGEALLAAGGAAQAVLEFDAVLAGEPHNPFALARSAEALLALGRAGEAEQRLRRAALLAPWRAEIRGALAGVLHRQGRFAEAAAEWMELVRLRPRDAAAWQSLGAALGRSGRAGEAVGAFARAAELLPASSDAQVRLAFAAVAAGDRSRAVAALERASDLAAPGTFAHSCALGVLLDDLGRFAASRPRLLACAPGSADFGEARLRLARQLLEAGEPERARAALDEAIAAEPVLAGRARSDPRLAALF